MASGAHGERLEQTTQEMVIALGRMEWSCRRIAKEVHIRHETVSKYLREAGIPIRGSGRWGHGRPTKAAKETIISAEDSASKPAKEVIDEPARRMSACALHHELVETAHRQGRTAMSIWQELVEDHAFSGRYASVQRYVRNHIEAESKPVHSVIVTGPGEEAQVDYGTGPLVRHPKSGTYQRTRLFILTLGYSRKSIRLLALKSSTKKWCAFHEQSFRRLGGVPKTVVLDNLKEGVAVPDYADPELNPLFREMLKHYGAIGLPCRVRDPNRKGKVESAVNHTQRALIGKKFETLESAQAWLDHWDERWAGPRVHGTTKRVVDDMFSEEKPYLHPLPIEPFRYFETGIRKVQFDGRIQIQGAFYHVPPRLVGQEVIVRFDERTVRILHRVTEALIGEHERTAPGHTRMRKSDRPKSTFPSVEEVLKQASVIGENTKKLADGLAVEHHSELAIRQIRSLLSLGKKYSPLSLEDACETALECGAPTYRFVARYLEKAPRAPPLKATGELIRDLKEYCALIEQMGETNEQDRNRTKLKIATT